MVTTIKNEFGQYFLFSTFYQEGELLFIGSKLFVEMKKFIDSSHERWVSMSKGGEESIYLGGWRGDVLGCREVERC